MKAVFAETALADLDEIFAYTATEYPSLLPALERRIRDVITHIEEWPKNARRLEGPGNVHVVPLVRYPFKVFYEIERDRILILHIHHAARRPWRQ